MNNLLTTLAIMHLKTDSLCFVTIQDTIICMSKSHWTELRFKVTDGTMHIYLFHRDIVYTFAKIQCTYREIYSLNRIKHAQDSQITNYRIL